VPTAPAETHGGRLFHRKRQTALDGRNGGDYDACPLYDQTPFVANGASVGNVTTQQNYLAVSSCNQDLRLNFDVHTTDLVFNIFNAKEVGYSDANVCVDSTALIPLIDSNTNVSSVTNFDFSNLGTAAPLMTCRAMPPTAPLAASGPLAPPKAQACSEWWLPTSQSRVEARL